MKELEEMDNQEMNPKDTLKNKFIGNKKAKQNLDKYFILLCIFSSILVIIIIVCANIIYSKNSLNKKINAQLKKLEFEISSKTDMVRKKEKQIQKISRENNQLKIQNINRKESLNQIINQLIKVQKLALANNYEIIEKFKKGYFLDFKIKNKEQVKLSNDCQTITREVNRENKNDTIVSYIDLVGDKSLKKNTINRWKIKINSLGEGIALGIGIFNNTLENKNNYFKKWNIESNGSFLQLPTKISRYHGFGGLKNGDVVEVIVDLINGTLGFIVNDVNYGIACTDVVVNQELELIPYIGISEYGKIDIKILNS